MGEMKPFKYKAKCNIKILNSVEGIKVMLELTDFILDVYVESLKNENPKITEKEIESELKKIMKWKMKCQNMLRK